jgi:glycine/D-amino acid oxidase-like deaminating enzyme
MTRTAEAIVIGSGALGASVAFHLLERGLREVVLIDQHEIGSQTSARAAGNAAQARGHHLMATIARDAVERFRRFRDETGEPLDYVESGSLALSWTVAGAEMLASLRDVADASGFDVALIDPARARELSQFLDPDGATAILHTPGDIYLEPAQLPLAYATAIEKRGGALLPRTAVTGILRAGTTVNGVSTEAGDIHAPVVIDAAGGWTRLVAERAGIRVPLVPVRHQLLVTHPVTGLLPNHPIVRFIDLNVYLRPSMGGVLLGAYEADPLVVDPPQQGRAFQVVDLELDLPMLNQVAAAIAPRFAPLSKLDGRLREVRGGLPTMTPDGLPLLGPVSGADGMYVLSGCCVGGFSIAPSLGALLADLIVDGRPSLDLSPMALDRFGLEWDDAWLVDACVREYSLVYDLRRDIVDATRHC